jgi:F-type H+-transporting ATPase subunit delta
MLKKANSFSIAKKLVEISLNEEGKVDPKKINLILAELRNKPMSHSLPVLRNLLSLIKTKINSYEGYLEQVDPCADSSSNLISENISLARGKKIDFVIEENKTLIAGFRLRIGDDVYEDSIASRIARLKKSLT